MKKYIPILMQMYQEMEEENNLQEDKYYKEYSRLRDNGEKYPIIPFDSVKYPLLLVNNIKWITKQLK